ncbi:hypothetical protein R6Q59_015021 [Mikania micrantha]
MRQPPGRYANSSYAYSSNLPQSSYSLVVQDKPVMVLDEAALVLDSTLGTFPSMVRVKVGNPDLVLIKSEGMSWDLRTMRSRVQVVGEGEAGGLGHNHLSVS